MGWGDEIMAAGRARVAHEADPQRRPVVITGLGGQHRWHEAWRGSPIILRPGDPRAQGAIRVKDGPRCRPYVDTRGSRWRFVAGRQTRGEICLDVKERSRAPGGLYAVIHPEVKTGRANKDWSRHRWQALAEMLGMRLVQSAPPGGRPIAGVEAVETATFREAAGVLAGAAMAVVPEGGMHHAAAALGVPAVVLYGGFITPDITGYPEQVAFVDRGPGTPCGVVKRPCEHCAAAWAGIEPAEVAKAAITLWRTANESRTSEEQDQSPEPNQDAHGVRRVHG